MSHLVPLLGKTQLDLTSTKLSKNPKARTEGFYHLLRSSAFLPVPWETRYQNELTLKSGKSKSCSLTTFQFGYAYLSMYALQSMIEVQV